MRAIAERQNIILVIINTKPTLYILIPILSTPNTIVHCYMEQVHGDYGVAGMHGTDGVGIITGMGTVIGIDIIGIGIEIIMDIMITIMERIMDIITMDTTEGIISKGVILVT